MELSNPESIREALQSYERPVEIRRRHAEAGPARTASQVQKVRCTCGHCRACLDNARWERIFAEKFADPNYYRRHTVSCSSPLTSL